MVVSNLVRYCYSSIGSSSQIFFKTRSCVCKDRNKIKPPAPVVNNSISRVTNNSLALARNFSLNLQFTREITKFGMATFFEIFCGGVRFRFFKPWLHFRPKYIIFWFPFSVLAAKIPTYFHIFRPGLSIPNSDQKRLKTHTLWRRTYPNSLYRGVPPRYKLTCRFFPILPRMKHSL